MKRERPPVPSSAASCRKELIDLLRANAHEHQLWQVWSDFVEMAALAISNAVDHAQRDAREARYLEIVKRYKPDQVERFPQALGALTAALQHEPSDVLGSVFMELELGNKWKGQFFTPFALCRLMSALEVPGLVELLESQRFVTANDPAVGAGATLIALAVELAEAGVNYQERLHVTGQDIDERAAHMAYVQLSLLHVPAVVIVGDTLRAPGQGPRWYTPAHVFGGWSRKLRGGIDVLSDLPALIDVALKLEPPALVAAEAEVVSTAPVELPAGQITMAWGVPARRQRRRAA